MISHHCGHHLHLTGKNSSVQSGSAWQQRWGELRGAHLTTGNHLRTSRAPVSRPAGKQTRDWWLETRRRVSEGGRRFRAAAPTQVRVCDGFRPGACACSQRRFRLTEPEPICSSDASAPLLLTAVAGLKTPCASTLHASVKAWKQQTKKKHHQRHHLF